MSKFDAGASMITQKRKEQTEVIEKIQGKTFGAWATNQLTKSGYKGIQDVTTDLKDGANFIYLCEALFDLKVDKKWNKNPTNEIHKNENVSIALEILKSKKVLTTVSSKEIVDGNKKLTLGLIWVLIMRHQMLKPGEEDDKPASQKNKAAKTNLLNFCQKQLQGYEKVEIKDMQESFYDGLAFCGLLHKLNPELVNYDEMLKLSPKERLTIAFEAGTKVGIPKLLEVEDMVNPDLNLRPDERCIMTYVSEFPIAFLEHQVVVEEEKKPTENFEELLQLQQLELKRQQEEHEKEKEAEIKQRNQQLLEEQERLKKEMEQKESADKEQVSKAFDDNKKLLDELEKLKNANALLQHDLEEAKGNLIGTIRVTVVEARNLPALDILGKSDPYVRLKLSTQEYKTPKKKKTLHPRFDNTYEFYLTDKRSVLEVSVWNSNRFLNDDFIGKISIPATELLEDSLDDRWRALVSLKDEKEDHHAEIKLAIKFKLGKF